MVKYMWAPAEQQSPDPPLPLVHYARCKAQVLNGHCPCQGLTLPCSYRWLKRMRRAWWEVVDGRVYETEEEWKIQAFVFALLRRDCTVVMKVILHVRSIAGISI